MPAPVRGRAIAHIGRLVEDNAEALARLVTAEIGKPYAEALGEVREIVDTCDFFLGEGRRLYGQTVPSEMADKQLFTFRKPVGAVAVITAGNFPVAVPSWYIVPALLAGNTIVWKPADYSPVGVERVLRAVRPRRRPARRGVQPGASRRAGDLRRAWSARWRQGPIDKVGFTGSSAVGREIGALTGRHLQTACLELGGKNPLVVTPSADLDLAVEGALFSGFGTAGQRCTSLGTVIVHESVHDEFLARFASAVAAAAVGDPTADVLMGPMLDAKFAERYEEYLDWIQPHHRVVGARGRITAENPRDGFVGDFAGGLFYHPVVVDGVRRGDAIFEQETFGPLVGVTTYREPGRGDRAGERAGLRAVQRDLHHRPEGRLHVPRPDRGGHGVDQQLHVRRGGAPAVRRQRKVRQRLATVRHLGARPVHPLAVGELGLLRPAAEGADGHRRADPGHDVPPLRTHGTDPSGRPSTPTSAPTSPDLSERQLAMASPGADNSEFWWGIFEAQAGSRWLDVVARELQARGEGFYTIGSAGHESNALVAAELRLTDPALLHYRSGAFYLARAAQLPGSTGVRDVLQGLMGLADEPIAGGRHKVFGHRELNVIPQTSTIASHLPRAVGLAMALHRARRVGVDPGYPTDAVVVCSFGDASANHSTAVGAINTALNASFRGLPVPILFVCEDNGLGISVPTPTGWIERAYGHRPGLRYDPADGSEPAAARAAIADAVTHVRTDREPVFLHLRTVRLLRARRLGRRDQLPDADCDRGRSRPRSPAGHGSGAGDPRRIGRRRARAL